MCGIAGIVSKQKIEINILRRMTDALSHRGPDGEGHWMNDCSTVALGHRRLSILDISECGAQPMHYLSRYSLVFNGEIYNYVEIRERLCRKGYRFRSNSDTEVLLALYDEKGTDCLKEIDGMFAFVLYDQVNQTVFMARDRFGEKPLFYGWHNGVLFFASEMKALWSAGLPKCINQKMLYNYLSKNLLENPSDKQETFFENICRFPPSHYALLPVTSNRIEPVRYWDIDTNGRDNSISESMAAQRFEELMITSIQRRLRSDVPLGSSLSGGLDSSLIVCLLDEIDKNNSIIRKTFSAQFPGFEKDESRYQQLVIERCRVEPHFVYPTEETMLKHLQKVMYHQEEPFGSASICVQFEVFQLAKENEVTVLLDGQGADEILAGYHSFFKPFFQGIKKTNKSLYTSQIKQYYQLHADNTINVQHQRSWKDYVKQIIPEGLQSTVLRKKRAEYSGEAALTSEFINAYGNSFDWPSSYSNLSGALYYETMNYGLETLLRYADRNSMAHSREVRLPFLYHELVEFLFQLPDQFKIRDGWTKWIMRKSFERKLPKEIAWRKDKIGYEPPQNRWLQTNVLQQPIHEAKEKLVSHGVLKKEVFQKDNPNLSWKLFGIANTLYA